MENQPNAALSTAPAESKPNLYDFAPDALRRLLETSIQPQFRARQIADWMYVRAADSFDAMSNLPKALREELATKFSLDLPQLKEVTEPASDGSQKYLFTLADGSLIESVFMPMGDRFSICLSSQAGCAVGCTFCVTGFFGAGRNLTPSEIVGQLVRIRNDKDLDPKQMNIVFMGMGEPLLNLANVEISLEIFYQLISPKRITLSTAGIVPGIEELSRMARRPNLAVSINSADRRKREEIMPITKKYPLETLIATLRQFPIEKGREITIEYVLLAGYNDSAEDARQLASLLHGVEAKVNVIPFNPDPNLPPWMKRPTDTAIDRFAAALVRARVDVTVRRSKGHEIAAACGQLRGKTEPQKPRAPVHREPRR